MSSQPFIDGINSLRMTWAWKDNHLSMGCWMLMTITIKWAFESVEKQEERTHTQFPTYRDIQWFNCIFHRKSSVLVKGGCRRGMRERVLTTTLVVPSLSSHWGWVKTSSRGVLTDDGTQGWDWGIFIFSGGPASLCGCGNIPDESIVGAEKTLRRPGRHIVVVNIKQNPSNLIFILEKYTGTHCAGYIPIPGWNTDRSHWCLLSVLVPRYNGMSLYIGAGWQVFLEDEQNVVLYNDGNYY